MADITRENIVRIDLAKTSLVRNYQPVIIGEGDNSANVFGVEVVRDGSPADLIGVNVTGYFIRPNRTTVIINGGAPVGNIASVTLPQACYAFDGVFSLAIKLTGGGVTSTMRIVDGAVINTNEGAEIDPGTVIPSIDELLEKIAECEAAAEDARKFVATEETIQWNQLNDNSAATSSAGGVTYTKNSNNTWTLTGAGTGTNRKQVATTFEANVGHVYAVTTGTKEIGSGTTWCVCTSKSGANLKQFYSDEVYTDKEGRGQLSIRTYSGFVAPAGGLTLAPQIFDLTQMFGAGNEPQSIEEFREMFPAVYSYDAGSVKGLTKLDLMNRQIGALKHAVFAPVVLYADDAAVEVVE